MATHIQNIFLHLSINGIEDPIIEPVIQEEQIDFQGRYIFAEAIEALLQNHQGLINRILLNEKPDTISRYNLFCRLKGTVSNIRNIIADEEMTFEETKFDWSSYHDKLRKIFKVYQAIVELTTFDADQLSFSGNSLEMIEKKYLQDDIPETLKYFLKWMKPKKAQTYIDQLERFLQKNRTDMRNIRARRNAAHGLLKLAKSG